MSDVRESVIEKYLVQELKKIQPLHRHVRKKIEGWRSWPDQMILFASKPGVKSKLGPWPDRPPVTHWLEVKRPKRGKYEPLQRRTHALLVRMGFTVRIVNTHELVDAYIRDLTMYGPCGVESYINLEL